jgi:hypothetical protein
MDIRRERGLFHQIHKLNKQNMKSNRRDFLRITGLTGIGLAGSSLLKAIGTEPAPFSSPGSQIFNMSGYAAPRLDTVRIGFIGLGNRGPGHVSSMSLLEGVDIRALCDVVPEEVEKTRKRIESTGFKPVLYSGDPEGWKKMCERDDIDLVYICTPWNMHAEMAVFAMEHGKHVAIEVPAAVTMDECWQLVETSEKTRKHCMMMENCCYDFFELLTLNMARQGFFGDIIHGEGAYIHNLLGSNFNKTGYWEMWRLEENSTRRGNLYPTHGLGPICQIMDINRGDRMNFLVSVMSADFMMNNTAKGLAEKDSYYKKYVDRKYRGNMTTTTVLTEKGRTIMIQHDVTSPNAYSRIHKVSGTKAAALKYPLPAKISIGDEWVKDEDMKALEEKYTAPIVRKVGELAKKVGGHGGMDFLENWRLIDCLRNGLPLDQDVYDAALWSAIAPLSEWSVESRSYPVPVPDFTRGAWKTNAPVDIKLEKGGTTKVIR